MGDEAPAACPHCGSADTKRFEDGSGRCNACGRAFRGAAPVGTGMRGEEVETVRRGPAPREKIRIGLIALVGSVLGFVSIPVVFFLGASLRGQDVSTYVSDTFNRPEGALVCGGVSLLVIAAWYASWAGFLVWKGFSERVLHLVIAGVLLTVAAAFAGLGLSGIVGIVGGILVLLAGIVVWWKTRAQESEESPPTSPESS